MEEKAIKYDLLIRYLKKLVNKTEYSYIDKDELKIILEILEVTNE